MNTVQVIQGGAKNTVPEIAILTGGAIASKIVSDLFPNKQNFTINALLILVIAGIAASYFNKNVFTKTFLFGVIIWQVLKLLFAKTGFGDINKYFPNVPILKKLKDLISPTKTTPVKQLQSGNSGRIAITNQYNSSHLLGFAGLACPGEDCKCNKKEKEEEVGLSCGCSVLGLGAISQSQMMQNGASSDLLSFIPEVQWDSIYNSCSGTDLLQLLSKSLSNARSSGFNITGVTVNPNGCSGQINYLIVSPGNTGTSPGTPIPPDTPTTPGTRIDPTVLPNTSSGKELLVGIQCTKEGVGFHAIERGTYKYYNADVACSVIIRDSSNVVLGSKSFNIGDEIYFEIPITTSGSFIAQFSYKGVIKEYAVTRCPDVGQVEEKSIVVNATSTPKPTTNPVADFAFSAQNCSRYVNFENRSTGAQSYTWDYGDGMKATGLNPGNHYYEPIKGNSFVVKLEARDANGKVSTIQKTVVLSDQSVNPIANFGSSTTKNVVSFSDQSTNAATWSWIFGDGTTSKEKNPTKTYANPGTYTVSLTVTNNCGLSHKIEKNVIISQTSTSCDDLVKLGLNTIALNFMDENTCLFVAKCPNVAQMIEAINCSLTNPNSPKSGMAKIQITSCDPADDKSNKIYYDLQGGSQKAVGLLVAPILQKIEMTGNLEVGSQINFNAVGENMELVIWDYGDGVTGTTPSHIYTKGGNYIVKATAKGCKTVTITKSVSISETAIITPNPSDQKLFLKDSFVLLGDQTACGIDQVKKEIVTQPQPKQETPTTPPTIIPPVERPKGKDTSYSTVKFEKLPVCLSTVICSTDPCTKHRLKNYPNRNRNYY